MSCYNQGQVYALWFRWWLFIRAAHAHFHARLYIMLVIYIVLVFRCCILYVYALHIKFATCSSLVLSKA